MLNINTLLEDHLLFSASFHSQLSIRYPFCMFKPSLCWAANYPSSFQWPLGYILIEQEWTQLRKRLIWFLTLLTVKSYIENNCTQLLAMLLSRSLSRSGNEPKMTGLRSHSRTLMFSWVRLSNCHRLTKHKAVGWVFSQSITVLRSEPNQTWQWVNCSHFNTTVIKLCCNLMT